MITILSLDKGFDLWSILCAIIIVIIWSVSHLHAHKLFVCTTDIRNLRLAIEKFESPSHLSWKDHLGNRDN